MKLKHTTCFALSLALAAALGGSALASPVPVDLTVENLNGQQRMVKTYELPPGTDPDTLKEPAFEYEGFTYTWAYTTKEEHPFRETKPAVETVTVETPKKDLSTLLEYLPPTVPYDDGTFTGELTLDHDTIVTITAGYKTQYAGQAGVLACGPPRQGGIRPGLNLPRTFSRAAGAEGGIVLTSNELWGHNSA